jgi:hypothetical protein
MDPAHILPWNMNRVIVVNITSHELGFGGVFWLSNITQKMNVDAVNYTISAFDPQKFSDNQMVL